jgi:hypothetical protein
MNTCLNIFSGVTEVMLLWYFFSGVFGTPKVSRPMRYVCFIGYSALLVFLFCSVENDWLLLFAVMAVTYVGVTLFYKAAWWKVVYPTILFFGFTLLSDGLTVCLLALSGVPVESFAGNIVAQVVYIGIRKLLHLLALYVTLCYWKREYKTRAMLRILPLFSCQVLSAAICYQNYLTLAKGVRPSLVILETLALLYINIVTCVYVEILNRTYKKKREEELARQQLDVQIHYYQDMVERQEKTRALWHDIKKYMAAMESLVMQDKRAEAQACLEDVKKSFSDTTGFAPSGHVTIDSVMAYGYKKAKESGVSITSRIWVDPHMECNTADLFVILGNTLDNAIEGCMNMEDEYLRSVSVTVLQQYNLLYYEITNPYREDEPKKRGSVHGYGLKNVRACVGKNNGLLEIKKDNGFYALSVMLNVNNGDD